MSHKYAMFYQTVKMGTSDALHFKLSHPIEYKDKNEQKQLTYDIVVSATSTPNHGEQTYIFPADKKGTVLSWTQHEGSLKGVMDHDAALKNAGYEAI
jgi:hypothetical protein